MSQAAVSALRDICRNGKSTNYKRTGPYLSSSFPFVHKDCIENGGTRIGCPDTTCFIQHAQPRASTRITLTANQHPLVSTAIYISMHILIDFADGKPWPVLNSSRHQEVAVAYPPSGFLISRRTRRITAYLRRREKRRHCSTAG